jgi:hypothetical protein
MRKLYVLLVIFSVFLMTKNVSAQLLKRPDQVLGLSFSTSDVRGTASLITDNSSVHANYTTTLRQYGIVYGFRYNIIKWGFGSISLGSPLMAGFSSTDKYRSEDFNGTKKDTITGITGLNFACEIPVFADFNLGLYSAEDESPKKRFGVYAGVGYMYSYTRIHTSVGRANYDGFEPAIRAGIRMGRRWEKRWSLALTMRAGYMNSGMRAYGLQLLKEL